MADFLNIGGAIGGVLGAITGAAGAVQKSNAASQAATYNAEIAAQNQQIANQNATAAIQSGEQQAAVSQQKTRAQMGAIRAGEAAAGVDVNSGSAVDVRSSAAELGELDALTVRSNAAKTAYGYQTQAISQGDQVSLDKAQAGSDTTAGEIEGATTFLGGTTSAAGNFAKYLNQNATFATASAT